ncbi:MAG: thioesterase family protein [Bacteroidia bacterium]|nr:thioesterase family protein [Bacteroidia bacterium]
MENKLTIGIEGKIEQFVTKDDTAAKYGSGLVEVFATPAMLALMEKTCLNSVLDYLNDGFNTVGTEVNIKHIKATPVGKKVYCKSVLNIIENKKLVFSVEAFDEEGKIGEGTHTRYIIDTKKFMEKL